MSDEECPHGLGDPSWCAVCKHGPARPAVDPEAVGTPFTARFPGICPECQDPIEVGELIVRRTDDRYVHEECR